MTVFFREHSVPSSGHERTLALERVRETATEAQAHEFAELWVNHADYPALTVLVSGNVAWLMLLRYDGDAGYSPRNPRYSDESGATITCYLGNGQRDTYPKHWAIPTVEALQAFVQFAETRKLPETIGWFNDSGDSSTGPNDANVVIPG